MPETALPRDVEAQTTDGLLKVDTTRKGGNTETSVTPANLKRTLTNPSISSERSSPNPELTNAPGYRAADAYVRPAPIYTNGTIIDYVFDLRNCQFTLNVEGTKMLSDETPTTVFLPEWHFPKEQCTVEVSGGKWEISTDDEETALVQKLRWWHSDGKQTLRIKGLVRPRSTLAGTSEEAGYLEQCQSSYGVDLKSCSVM